MKEIDIAQATTTLGEYARTGVDRAVIVTKAGRPVIAVVSLEGLDRESLVVSTNPRFIAILEESRASYRREGGISQDQIEAELGIAKKPKPKTKPARKARRRAS